MGIPSLLLFSKMYPQFLSPSTRFTELNPSLRHLAKGMALRQAGRKKKNQEEQKEKKEKLGGLLPDSGLGNDKGLKNGGSCHMSVPRDFRGVSSRG